VTVTTVLYVASSGDDGYCVDPSTFINTYNRCQFGHSSVSADFDAFFRFPSSGIPQGSVIVSAVLTVKEKYGKSGPVNVRIKGCAEDDSAQMSSYADYHGRSRTSAYTDWSPEDWLSGVEYNSPDISAVVQEIVDRAGFDGGSIQIVIDEYSSGATNNRAPTSYDDGYYTYLTVEYVVPAEGSFFVMW